MVGFSIVIPTYNRPERLKFCLDSLTNLKYPKANYEVIVSDDGSEIDLTLLIKQFESQISIKYLKSKNAGPASARNRGADLATHEYLVFLDDDCQMSPSFLTIVSKQLEITPNVMIGGHSINSLANIYSKASQALIDYLYSYFNRDNQNAQFITSGNMVVSNSQFQKIGGFDTNFPLAAAEDREFCDRWIFEENTILFLKEAIVYHFHELTFPEFWRQHFRYGKGAAHYHKVFAERRHQNIKIEPLNFYWNLIKFPFKQKISWTSFKIFILLMISQIANIRGYFHEA